MNSTQLKEKIDGSLSNKLNQALPYPKKEKGPLAKIIRSLVWLSALPLILLAAIEGTFFLAHVGEEEFLKISPDFGFTHLENKLVTFRSEGYSQERINSAGFRDKEFNLTKPPATLRIAVLGDSKTEGMQVPLNSTFAKQLEAMLNKQFGRAKVSGQAQHYEVLNFGMSAFSTGQEYLQYLCQVQKYHPDIVVVIYHYGDLEENIPLSTDGASICRPTFTLDDKGNLLLDWSNFHYWLVGERAKRYIAFDGLRRNSRIWGVITRLEGTLSADKSMARIFKLLEKPMAPLWNFYLSHLPRHELKTITLSDIDPSYKLSAVKPTAVEKAPSQQDAHNPQAATKPNNLAAAPSPGLGASSAATPSANASDAIAFRNLVTLQNSRWPVTEAILRQFNKACNHNGAKFVVAGLPAPNNSILYFQQLKLLNQQAHADNFTFIDVNAEFPQLDPMQESRLFLRRYHFSKLGHKLVADTLLKGLVQDRLIN
jgi:hypothetical protein